jgi:hypothetical protein
LVWVDNPHHPGHYEVQIQIPVHDGGTGEIFLNVRGYPPSLIIQYEELADFLGAVAVSHGSLRAIEGHKETILAGWEIFLYAFDRYIAKSASPKLREAIEESLDLDLPLEERYYSYIEATNHLIVDHVSVFERYETLIHSHTKRSLSWLARLVNGV